MRDRRVIYLAASCALYLLLWLFAPHVRVPRLLLIALFMLVQLSIPRWLASLGIKPKWAAAALAGALAAWVAVVFAVSARYVPYDTKELGRVPVPIARIRERPLPAVMDLPARQFVRSANGRITSSRPIKVKGYRRPADLSFRLIAFERGAGRARALTSLLMVLAASAFGCLVSLILREPNILLPVAGLSAYVDIWTVLLGPTSFAVEKAPQLVSAVSVAMPAPGGTAAGFGVLSYVGPADFIFFAMFLAAAYRLKMEPRRTFWVSLPVLTLGMAAVVSGLFHTGLPALILIGLSVIVANYKHFKPTRDEYIAMAIVALILAAAIAVVTPFVRHGR